MPSDDSEGMDVRAIWHVVTQGWWILVLGAVAGGVAAYFISTAQPPSYEAQVKLLVQGSRTPGTPSASDLQTSESLARNFLELIKTRSNLDETAQAIGMPEGSGEGLRGSVSVSSPGTFIAITGHDSDPDRAAAIANAMARVFIDDFRRRQFTQIAQFQASLATFGIGQNEAIIAAQAATLTALSVVEDAVPPGRPSSPRTRRDVLLAGFAGLLIAGLLLLAREYLDDRVQSAEELRNLTGFRSISGVSTVGSVRRYRRARSYEAMILTNEPATGLVEAYEFLHTNIEFAAMSMSKLRSLLVTSATPQEGKTTTASNLAISIARAGKSVILVDCDLRRPMLHKIFSTGDAKGLTRLLLETATVEEAMGPTEVEGLSVVPAGPLPPDPSQVIRSSRMRDVVAKLEESSDLVIFDSPPLLAVTDAVLIASLVDGVLLVVDTGHTRRQAVRQSVELLKQANAEIVGAVLNKVSSRNASYYGSYYHDYSSDGVSGNGTGPSSRRRRVRARLSGLKRLLQRKAPADA